MHISITVGPPILELPDQIQWHITDDSPLEAAVPQLLENLKKKKMNESEAMTQEDFKELFSLFPAAKAKQTDLNFQENGDPIPWDTIAEPPDFITGAEFLLRKKTDEDNEKLQKLDQPTPLEDLDILPEEPPPPLGLEGETGIGTSTADIPKFNEVQVSGQLPLQHLKISALSWKGMPKKGTDGLRNRPVSTATMCPSCGTPFAMNIPDTVMKDKMLSSDMEKQLNDALDAQRSVLDGEKKMLESEVNDLKTALASINASLSRSREDGEELSQLAEQQRQWTEWLEVEVRQTKGEIGQVGTDFDQCLKSNQDLTGLVETAIARKVEAKYWNGASRRGGLPAQPSTSSAPQPPSPLQVPHDIPSYSDPYLHTSSSRSAKRDRFRDIVTRYYQRHNPTKMGLVETLVDEYEGKERELLNLMARKYGDVSILSYDPLIDDDLAPGSTSGYPAGPSDVGYPPSRGKRPDAKIQSLLDNFVDRDTATSSSLSGFSDINRPRLHRPASTGPSSDPSKVTFELPPSSDVYRPGARRGPPPLQPASSYLN